MMRRYLPAIIAVMLLGACDRQEAARGDGPSAAETRDPVSPASPAAKQAEPQSTPRPGAKAAATPPPPEPSAQAPSPCLVQDGLQLAVKPLRALGTEPFWDARIEGRCVTYHHFDDPKGTRVWTRFTAEPQGGLWSGALGGRPFELRTRAKPDCSDGMSDKRYPIAVELLVHGERREGCAEPM